MADTGRTSESVKWVFFDVGDVLYNEDPQHLYLFHSMLAALRAHGTDVGWDDLLAQIREEVRRDPVHFMQNVVRAFLSDASLFDAVYQEGRTAYEAIRKPRPYGVLLDGMTPVLQELKRDGYRLGVIANQHPPILDSFSSYGIASFFDIVLIDEVVGISKPDPAIFEMAFRQAGCRPGATIMVGDRPDVDIAPARTLGMKTIRFQRGLLYPHYDPKTDLERADRVVSQVDLIPDAVRKLSHP